jgi:hypothetical protein
MASPNPVVLCPESHMPKEKGGSGLEVGSARDASASLRLTPPYTKKRGVGGGEGPIILLSLPTDLLHNSQWCYAPEMVALQLKPLSLNRIPCPQ